jgi:hypothetical protein
MAYSVSKVEVDRLRLRHRVAGQGGAERRQRCADGLLDGGPRFIVNDRALRNALLRGALRFQE